MVDSPWGRRFEVNFERLQKRLIDRLRAKVRNGEITERRLARIAGLSQPHVHNALKGIRALSPEASDRILRELRISILDLIDREEWEKVRN
jgi:hypothetical protein